MAQPLDDAADDDGHYGEEQHREERQLPRDGDHHHRVADDEERLAEGHLQRIGDAELHHAHVRRDLRDDVALALFAEIAHVHVNDLGEHPVADALQRPRAHVLDRPGPQIAEQVAQETDADGHHGQQHQHVLHPELVEQVRVGIVEQCGQVALVQGQGRQFVDVLERIVRIEHRVQNRDDEQERARIEQRVEQRIEKVRDGIFLDRLGEAEQSEVCLEH